VLRFLQGHARWDVKSLAVEEECSERTIFRILDVLKFAGVLVDYDKDHRCYALRPDYRFPVLNLTEDELLGQAAATAITQAPGLQVGKGARPTTEKLAAVSQEDVAQLLTEAEQVVTVLDLKLSDHSRHLETIRTIQWALVQKKQLTGLYKSPYEERPVRLNLHPYRLALIKASWYLIARSTKDEQPRTYRVPRFKMLRFVDRPAVVPADFDIKAYFGNAWSVFRGETTYDVEILFTPEAADLVTETRWHPTQKVGRHQDGSVTLKFRVDGLNELVRWVLGWSGKATVIQPDELRELVVKQLQAALSMNGGISKPKGNDKQ
jgi:predicted DNA-binding transcriptional regulator YafY